MIVQVYLLRRMPRRMGFFDYEVPEGMRVKRGDLVRIPFREAIVFGIVRDLVAHGSSSISRKSLLSIEWPGAVSDVDLHAYEQLACELAQSVSSILAASLPVSVQPKQMDEPVEATRLGVRPSDAIQLHTWLSFLSLRPAVFLQTPHHRLSLALAEAWIHQHPTQRVLVLAPTVADVSRVASLVSHDHPLTYVGEHSLSKRFAIWRRWQEGSARLLIGTRAVALLPLQGVDTVFVLRSGHEQYLQKDRHPRFSTMDRLWSGRSTFGYRVVAVDAAPGPLDLWRFGSENLALSPTRSATVTAALIPAYGYGHPLLTQSLVDLVSSCIARGTQARLWFRRKTSWTFLVCRDCGFRWQCSSCELPMRLEEDHVFCMRCQRQEPFSGSCPSCRGSQIRERRYGRADLVAALVKLFPAARVSVADEDSTPDPQAQIVVSTSVGHESTWSAYATDARAGCVVELDADLACQPDGASAFERGVWAVSQTRALASLWRVPYLLQSRVPERFLEALSSPEVSLRETLEARNWFRLPPTWRSVTLLIRADAPSDVRLALERLRTQLARVIGTKDTLRSMTQRGRSGYLLRTDPVTFDRVLPHLQTAPDSIIIDTMCEL